MCERELLMDIRIKWPKVTISTMDDDPNTVVITEVLDDESKIPNAIYVPGNVCTILIGNENDEIIIQR
jgi:hypothetical protein